MIASISDLGELKMLAAFSGVKWSLTLQIIENLKFQMLLGRKAFGEFGGEFGFS